MLEREAKWVVLMTEKVWREFMHDVFSWAAIFTGLFCLIILWVLSAR